MLLTIYNIRILFCYLVCFICGRQSVAVTRHQMIVLFFYVVVEAI